MNANSEIPQQINEVETSASSVHDDLSTNGSGTDSKSGTPLTQRRSPPVPGSKVYFIKSKDTIKIGWSLDPKQRLKDLQAGSSDDLELIATMDGGRRDEKRLHKQFAAFCFRREWFIADPSLLDFIASNAEKYEPKPAWVWPTLPPKVDRVGPTLDTLAVMRNLTALRGKHGHKSKIGYRCSNLIEMMKQLPPGPEHRIEYLTQDGVRYQRNRLTENIERQSAELQSMLVAR